MGSARQRTSVTDAETTVPVTAAAGRAADGVGFGASRAITVGGAGGASVGAFGGSGFGARHRLGRDLRRGRDGLRFLALRLRFGLGALHDLPTFGGGLLDHPGRLAFHLLLGRVAQSCRVGGRRRARVGDDLRGLLACGLEQVRSLLVEPTEEAGDLFVRRSSGW